MKNKNLKLKPVKFTRQDRLLNVFGKNGQTYKHGHYLAYDESHFVLEPMEHMDVLDISLSCTGAAINN